VVVMRGRLNTTTDVRSADTTAACGRNGEAQACGAYFILTDELPKPLALLDDTGKHARRLNWDGFGMTNRLELRSGAQSQHPYPANDYESLYGAHPTLTAGVSTALRFEVEVLDTEGSASAPVDFLELRQSYVAQSQTGGAHRGRVYTPWIVADGGYVQLAFLSGPRSCPPEGCLADGGLPDGGSYPYYGALVAAVETAERQGGAKAFDIPIRFPGQYYDAESQKHENHNRYLNPLLGAYLSPEPLLQDPNWLKGQSSAGYSVPTYSYARNNPLQYTDPDGLQTLDTYSNCVKKATEAGVDPKLACGEGPDYIPNPDWERCNRLRIECKNACNSVCDPDSYFSRTKLFTCYAICDIALAACMAKAPLRPN